MHLVQEFEKLLSIPSSKDSNEQNGEEEVAEEIGKKAAKWALPRLQPLSKALETQVSSSSFFPLDLFLTSDNLGLDWRTSIFSSWRLKMID
ncbi:caldesmon [Pyrus ussuriensis x Pyrus communis]|uniref:Caldesmon n=1 Tax=Pyrus ussuriensis x Pyrus communis TaxID=2448454 RepID=A0A5N5G6M5_9ROSA|nr:caldesmon [Pyrus ussuriensis x Pyrus communis]